MRIYFILFLSIILHTSLSHASTSAQEYKVSGRILDQSSGEPLAFATVSIHDKNTGTLITGTITQDQGTFEFNVQPGSYFIEVKFISYISQTIDVQVTNANVDLKSIALSSDSKQLEEVVIKGQKDQFEFSLDKKTFNVSENISNIGKNASDILDNIPSVQVDIEGNVSLRGNDNVTILINGKPSGMVGISSQAALKQLQGSMIERIEVITNPSARYDAAGTGGIINIILKEDAEKGFNGSFGIDVGYPALASPNASINYRSGKFNFFASAGLRYSEYTGYGKSYSTYFEPDSTFSTDSDRKHGGSSMSQNYRLGTDFFINDYNKLTLTGIFNTSDEENETRLIYQDIAQDVMINTSNRLDKEGEDDNLTEISLNYEKKFAQEDRVLTFYGQYRDNNELEKSDIQQVSLNDADLYQRVRNDEGENNILLQTDYIHPINEQSKFEVGLRTTIRKTKNNYLIEQQDGAVWTTLPRFSNDFSYHENIYAGYAIYGNKIGQVSFQLGARVETTDIQTVLTSENLDDTSDKNYTNFFPSAHFTYEFSPEQNIQLSYSRRLRRPGFRDLNPISSYSDNRNFRIGNPDLDPELTDSYEIGFLQNWEKSSFYGGVYYNHTNDEIERLSFTSTEPDEEGVIYSKLYNLATEDAYGLEFNVSKDFTDWMSMNGSFNFYRRITSGEAEGQTFDADARSYSARVNSKFNLPGDIDFQANLNYRGPQNNTQGKRLAFYTVDLGFTRDILNNNGTLTASVQDLFNTRKYRSEQYDDGFKSISEFQRRSRQFTLSFVYRLNQKKEREPRDKGNKGPTQGNNTDGDLN
ncbi:TonB-dependent receptor [Reichenbachiella agarivorans]|uniref:TonB-dependent receptor n=1 Tax=Reichenbachiella agarivorans TaxID=2979464 RepID=A0ABY6CU45_9BACT|nr:TonB-dependent receptor [Reichenbachiella agarivorans]UXP34037.1 TonB-dependent receptor [Reichenbachiella agarivorans]